MEINYNDLTVEIEECNDDDLVLVIVSTRDTQQAMTDVCPNEDIHSTDADLKQTEYEFEDGIIDKMISNVFKNFFFSDPHPAECKKRRTQ